jgi:hypothetical protein
VTRLDYARQPTVRSSIRMLPCVALWSLLLAATGLAQSTPPRAAQPAPPPEARPAQAPAETPAPSAPGFHSRRAAMPQGFSVVLVLGDIQGASTTDDVPPAARKALADMRDFLPFKAYRLLDAAWMMCCGQQSSSGWGSSQSMVLRGPDESEYELKLSTSRAENGRVFVRFSLLGGGTSSEVSIETAASHLSRTTTRKIADLKDQASLLEKQIQEAKRKAEVGVAPASEVPKLEVELRRTNREIEDLSARVAESTARTNRSSARASVAPRARTAIIDTTFTMDVGETVVVGTSRLKGGAKALIALLTAVPPRATTGKE